MIGDMGTMGPDGLSTKVGTGAANPLKPGDLNTNPGPSWPTTANMILSGTVRSLLSLYHCSALYEPRVA